MFGIQFVGDKFEILVTEMTVQVTNILNVTNIIVAHSPNSIPFHILNQRLFSSFFQFQHLEKASAEIFDTFFIAAEPNIEVDPSHAEPTIKSEKERF